MAEFAHDRRELRNSMMLFLFLLICYTYTLPRWADPNQNSRLDMVIAVVDDGTFQIDKYVNNTVDYAKVGEHYYSDKAPGVAFLGIPVYAGLKLILRTSFIEALVQRLQQNSAFQSTLRNDGSGVYSQKVQFALAQVILTLVSATLPSAILGVLVYHTLASIVTDAALRVAVVLGYGLLTPAFAYAGALYGHQLSAALLFGAFYILFTRRESFACSGLASIPGLLLIGFLLGYSVVTEYPAALIAGTLFLYATYQLYKAKRLWRVLWIVVSGSVVLSAWLAYNTAVFGGPLELGYSHSTLWVEQHHSGFMSLTTPRLDTVWGITLGTFRGLFFLSPLLLLSIPGFVLWWRSRLVRAEFWVAVSSVALFLLFNASSSMWWGGFAIGPRYLLPALPFMALPLIFVLRGLDPTHRVRRVVVAILALWSLLAIWGLTLAGQAFPADSIRNPLWEYAWPMWLSGNIARNLGTVIGLSGVWSLLPLLAMLALLIIIWQFLERNHKTLSLATTSHRPAVQRDPAKTHSWH